MRRFLLYVACCMEAKVCRKINVSFQYCRVGRETRLDMTLG
jgi:hypothetical protein